MSLRIGVAGATGAVGREVIKVLDRTPWRPDEIVPLARPSTAQPFAEYGEAQVAVDNLDDQALDELDALILAVPRDVARVAGERAVREGTPVVDCSGALSDLGPSVVPWINPEHLAQAVEDRVACVPWAPSVLLASALGPLCRAGITGPWHATVDLPASAWGRDGMDELSRQVVALFNQGTPPRRVFPHGLAFDLLPQVGLLQDSGWTDLEERVAGEAASLAEASAGQVSLVGAPLFSGLGAVLRLHPQRQIMDGLVQRVLTDGGLRLPKSAAVRHLPRVRRVEGGPFAHVARVRAEESALTLWLAVDNLAATATAAVALCAALVRVGSD